MGLYFYVMHKIERNLKNEFSKATRGFSKSFLSIYNANETTSLFFYTSIITLLVTAD